MGEPYNTLNHFKSAVTYRLLIAPANDNYFLARWCRINKLHAEFFWQAQQAIEKYIKAALAVNDVPTQGIGHNLSKAFEKYKATFGDLAPQGFKKPRTLSKKIWRLKTPERFLEKIEIQGSPDSRYRLISWHSDPNDLFLLDQLVFQIRRTTVGIHWIIGSNWNVRASQKRYIGSTFGDVIRVRPRFQPRSKIRVPSGPATVAGDRLEDAFFAWNFPYRRSPDDIKRKAPSSITSIIGSFSNSETYLLYNRLNTASRTTTPILIDGVRWFIDHFHLDRDVRRAFDQKLTQAILRT